MSENKTSGDGSVLNGLASIPMAPADPILGTKVAFMNDPSPSKVNLGIGAYRTDEGKPYVLEAVRAAERMINDDKSLNHEYLPQRGDDGLIESARAMLFGVNRPAVLEKRIATVQSISGTGSLRIGSEFLATFLPGRTVYVSKPTWGNHLKVLRNAGVAAAEYRYWNPAMCGLDIDAMLADLSAAPNGSVILLHGCAHNPTGVDPTKEQWAQIADVCANKGHFCWFDVAYQGFATGSLDEDAWSLRMFADRRIPMACCQSFAKNFGLYNERCGTYSVVCADATIAAKVMSQLAGIIRPMYSNPPAQGARIVHRILTTPALYAKWESELQMMSKRISWCRDALYGELVKLGTPGDWKHIVTQIGMFTFSGLSVAQCKTLISKHHVYLLTNGRISMCGVNTKNVQYLARAIDDVVRNVHA